MLYVREKLNVIRVSQTTYSFFSNIRLIEIRLQRKHNSAENFTSYRLCLPKFIGRNRTQAS